MKKTLLSLTLLAAISGAAFAQTANGTFTFTPSTQTVNPGDSFTITVGYVGDTPPSDAAAFDLYLVTAAANANLFTITSDVAGTPWSNPSGTFPAGGSNFTTSDSAVTTGFAINDTDLGFGGADQTAPYNFSNLATLTIQTGALTPGATYTFFSSTSATATFKFSDLTNNVGDAYEVPQSSFSITAGASAVPEPATWSLLGLGGLGSVGMTMLRRRRS